MVVDLRTGDVTKPCTDRDVCKLVGRYVVVAEGTLRDASTGATMTLAPSAAEWQGRNGWSFLVKLDGEAASNALTYRGTARFRYEW